MRMNRNKKLIGAIGLTGVMLLFCVGCGDKSTTTITLSQDNISIEGKGATSDGNTVTITSAGCYEISGTLSEGQIKIDTENETDKVELVLNGVELSNTVESTIYEKQAGQVAITLAKGSENTISSGKESMYEEALEEAKASLSDTENTSDTAESEQAEKNNTGESNENAESVESTQQITTATKAAIYIKDSLTVSGEGSLEVNGYLNNGIQAKEDLEILSGTITVIASNDGIKSGADVEISDGTVTTTTVGDGISADYNLTIADGTFNIKTGEGAGEVKDMGGDMPADVEKKNEETASDTEISKKNSTEENNKTETDTEDATDENELQEQSKHRGGPRQDFFEEDFQEDSSQDSGVSQKGLKSGATLTIGGGKFTFDTTDDAVHSNDAVVIDDGTMEIATGDDGVHADNSLTVNDGTINIVQSNEGLEAIEIVINNGDIDVVSSDDGLNACGGTSSFGMGRGREILDPNDTTTETTDTEDGTEESAEPTLTINGGDLSINANGDGIDSNGSIYITGGNVHVDGPENGGNSAIDIGTENNGICQISGGTVVGVGYADMAEAIDSSSTQCSLMYVFDRTVSAGTEIVIADEDGKEVASVTTVKNCDSIIYSSEELSQGTTYTITADDQSGELTLEDSYTTNSTSSGRFGGHGGPMDRDRTGQGTTDGMEQNEDRPEMPDGERPSGDRPEVPDGEKPSGDRPEMPDGEKTSGDRPEMPDEQITSGDKSANNSTEA